MLRYAADFETITDPADVRVWAWAIQGVDTPIFDMGNTLDGFMEMIQIRNDAIYYFHNLKFDGGFLLSWLLNHGFKYMEGNNPDPYCFCTLISDTNMFYRIKVKFKSRVVTFLDSNKIIPLRIEKFPGAFGLPIKKGEIDYNLNREVGHMITEEEKDYIEHDVKILAGGLKYIFDQNLFKITQASNAFDYFKKMIDTEEWKRLFPTLKYDKELRKAYRGGYCIVRKGRELKDYGKGIVFDKNSMYPTMMKNKVLPFGEPKYYQGKYIPNKTYPLYIQRIEVLGLEVKENYLPTIQLKHTMSYMKSEYIYKHDEPLILTLTNVDLELMVEHYNITEDDIEYIDGWMFMGTRTIFGHYVDYWYQIKQQADRDKNPGLRTIAKIMLNALYGKFGSRTELCTKIPYLDDGVVKYKRGKIEEKKPIYVPIAAFITAYARNDIIRLGQKYYDRLLYIDTDSLHLLGWEIPEGLDIDKYRLGAWKQEYRFTRARYIRTKCYIEEDEEWGWSEGKTENGIKYRTFSPIQYVRCSGLPETIHYKVTFDNFKPGMIYSGKLAHKTVKGGVVLLPTTFELTD